MYIKHWRGFRGANYWTIPLVPDIAKNFSKRHCPSFAEATKFLKIPKKYPAQMRC